MAIYNIYLIDLVPDQARRLVRFGDSQKPEIVNGLTALFRQVCNTTGNVPHANFLPGTPHLHELVVYFVMDRTKSIIDREGGGSATQHNGGRTAWLGGGRGMLSEVYVAESGPTIARTVNVAFHELMHNKIDMHPQLRLFPDIHNLGIPDGGGGLASSPVGANSILLAGNRDLMRQTLQTQIRQYWNPDLIHNPRHPWRRAGLLAP